MSQIRTLLSLERQHQLDPAENVRLDAVPGAFVNLTGLAVGDQIAALLSYGPRFLMPEDATIPGVISQFGEIHEQIDRHLGIGITGPIFLELLDKYRAERDQLFTQRQPSLIETAIRKAVVETKEFFRRYPQICIVQSDKGNKTCLMTINEYKTKMGAYIEKCITKGVYRVTNTHRVDATRNLFKRLRSAILAAQIPESDLELKKLCEQLRQFDDARLPHLYGNVKCHKPDTPIRPICSTVSWYSRPIQKILYHVLRRYFESGLCQQNVRRINDVVKKIKTIQRRPGYVFVKLDVTDMYGSMDKRRISLLLNRLLDAVEKTTSPILPKELVKRMVQFSLEHSCLIGYGQQIFVQSMGLPQGACDSGYLATIYLDYVLQLHHEELFVSHQVKFWAKYMDDFLLYMPSRNVDFFKQKIEFLTGLKFEVEPEETPTEGGYVEKGVIRSISFLDIYIHTLNEGPYLISSFRKPSASLRMIHAFSNTIQVYKVNTIHGFLNSIFQRTSTRFLEQDLNALYHRILMNGYSQNFIECIFYKALTDEEKTLHEEIRRTQCNMTLSIQQRNAKAHADKCRIQILQGYKSQFSFDLSHHYQTIRANYVSTSRQPGYRFQYRSVSMSRLIFAACQYANMPPPVYCRTEDTNIFRKYLGHKRIQEAMRTTEQIDAARKPQAHISVGMLRCLTCSTIFVVSGRDKLTKIVEREFKRPDSEISQHQDKLQHTISPAYQVLRPVSGVDTAYLCQLYLAIFQTVGLSTTDRAVLSSLPSFVRTMLYILRGTPISHSIEYCVDTSLTTWLTQAVPYLPGYRDDEPRSWGSSPWNQEEDINHETTPPTNNRAITTATSLEEDITYERANAVTRAASPVLAASPSNSENLQTGRAPDDVPILGSQVNVQHASTLNQSDENQHEPGNDRPPVASVENCIPQPSSSIIRIPGNLRASSHPTNAFFGLFQDAVPASSTPQINLMISPTGDRNSSCVFSPGQSSFILPPGQSALVPPDAGIHDGTSVPPPPSQWSGFSNFNQGLPHQPHETVIFTRPFVIRMRRMPMPPTNSYNHPAKILRLNPEDY